MDTLTVNLEYHLNEENTQSTESALEQIILFFEASLFEDLESILAKNLGNW